VRDEILLVRNSFMAAFRNVVFEERNTVRSAASEISDEFFWLIMPSSEGLL
jgi:hypothetical protein